MEIHPNSLNFFSVRLAQLDPERSLLRVCSGSSTSKGIIPRILYQTQRGTFWDHIGPAFRRYQIIKNYFDSFHIDSTLLIFTIFCECSWMITQSFLRVFDTSVTLLIFGWTFHPKLQKVLILNYLKVNMSK